MDKKYKKAGFSLAELVIAIALVGVLAAMILPSITTQFQETIQRNSAKVYKERLAQGVTMLSIRAPRMVFNSTEAFVNELEKYSTITKVCNSDNISQCWPYANIKLANDEEYGIAGATGKSVFGMGNTDPLGNDADYADDNVALILKGGAPVLINFNKKCDPNTQDINRTCYVALMDVNADRAPNKIGKDLKLINASTFANSTDNSNETSGVTGAKDIDLGNFNDNNIWQD